MLQNRQRAARNQTRNPEHYKAYRDQYKRSVHFLEQRIQTVYGGEYGQHQRLYDEQNGKCAICKVAKPLVGEDRLCVDHCHATGRVRGLLCQACNGGLGRFRDNTDALRSAIEYLEGAP